MKQNPANSNKLPKLVAPAQRALTSVGITSLVQLTNIIEAELLQLHGMGKNALTTLRNAAEPGRWAA